jgi:hypothetical protein
MPTQATLRKLVFAKSSTRILKPGKGYRPCSFDPIQLARGILVELEHTHRLTVAREIAMDHLQEFPSYYQALAKMERELAKRHK